MATISGFNNATASSSSSGISSKEQRTYSDAVECLNSLQSNAATIDKIKASGTNRNHKLIPETIDYLERIGYKAQDLNALNVIHITGTKGKGSTSAFCNSLLNTLVPKARVGLFTSPHMVSVCERIRINGKPIEREKFAKYFFEVWDKLEQNPKLLFEDSLPKPAYFRYLTIMAFHVFLSEKVDATILEVGIGGTYDSTNIVPKPLTTGITTLGIDHVFVLGQTIPEIAHQKGGIYKEGVPALSVANQPAEGLEVLEKRAQELKASSFEVVQHHQQMNCIQLGIAGFHQKTNASLALALVRTFFHAPNIPEVFSEAVDSIPEDSKTPLPAPVVSALENARWPGRCQTVQDRQPEREKVTWYLDGAHTVESLALCGEWYSEEAFKKERARKRVMIFNCTSGRSAGAMLGAITGSMAGVIRSKQHQPEEDPLFDHVIFTTNVTYSEGGFSQDLSSKAVSDTDLAALTVQNELAAAWRKLSTTKSDLSGLAKTQVHVVGSIQHAVGIVTSLAQDEKREPVDVLVTGSLHLIGGIFEVAKLHFAL